MSGGRMMNHIWTQTNERYNKVRETSKKTRKTIQDFMNEFGPSVQRKRAQRDEKWDEMIRVLTIQERDRNE